MFRRYQFGLWTVLKSWCYHNLDYHNLDYCSLNCVANQRLTFIETPGIPAYGIIARRQYMPVPDRQNSKTCAVRTLHRSDSFGTAKARNARFLPASYSFSTQPF